MQISKITVLCLLLKLTIGEVNSLRFLAIEMDKMCFVAKFEML